MAFLPRLQVPRFFLGVVVGMILAVSWHDGSHVLASSSTGMILRIRLGDGSMERVQVSPGSEDSTTLEQILKSFPVEEGSTIQVGNVKVANAQEQTITGLGLKHGSLISISAPPSAKSDGNSKPMESRFAQLRQDSNRWDPFPDLAKNYEQALLKTKTRRSSNKGMSYGDIAHLQSSLHILEPQPEGPVKRIYICSNSAERFQVNGITKPKKGSGGSSSVASRAGLLFGTVQRERTDKHRPRKARTSLSSQVSDDEYVTVAKVHAIWEPPRQDSKSKVYDAKMCQKMIDDNPRVIEVADRLGLVPIGWIFSYQGDRHKADKSGDDDALPMFGLDVQTGAMLQISNMRSVRDRIEGSKFVTLAMDATAGGVEAFQLSDVSVQMVAEGILSPKDGPENVPNKRHLPLKREVLIDGKETKQLDSVLCLVNTAVLSHVGTFAGKSAASSIKKNGSLTAKTKKALLAAMDDDSKLLQELCDMNTILACDQILSNDNSAKLCELVRKYARGQKRGTEVDSKLKLQLRSILES